VPKVEGFHLDLAPLLEREPFGNRLDKLVKSARREREE